LQDRTTDDTCLLNVKRRSRTTPSTLMSSATGRSTPVTFTDDREDAARSWLAVPMMSAYDLFGFSWSPFCMNQSLTSAVQVARMDRPEAVLSARIGQRIVTRFFAFTALATLCSTKYKTISQCL